jgi:hypothetical protein
VSKTLKIAALAISILIAGCSTNPVGTDSASAASMNAGFLSNYSNLRPVEGKEGIQRYIDRSRDVCRFSKLYIDPVQVFISNDPESYKGVPRRLTSSTATKSLTLVLRTSFAALRNCLRMASAAFFYTGLLARAKQHWQRCCLNVLKRDAQATA